MKLLTKQQALKAYLAGYTIVYNMESKSYKSFRLSSVTEFRCKRIILK